VETYALTPKSRKPDEIAGCLQYAFDPITAFGVAACALPMGLIPALKLMAAIKADIINAGISFFCFIKISLEFYKYRFKYNLLLGSYLVQHVCCVESSSKYDYL
jgi:hypothetical protein